MESLYKPDGVESRWQELWEAEGLYAAGVGATRDESYVICVPPPNVTGDLHLGHALNGSIQDVLIRWHRMQGYRTLWQPGYDHAGISTQNVVEKQLAAEGLTRHDLGREAFIERTWEWLEQTGRTIMGQYRRLGASLDYSRERFTLDDAYSRAVTEFFVRLWDRGWIYRANRIVNWCPFHQTAISDLEVEHVEMDDMLTYVRYPFVDGDGTDGIVIATVRPATILGDVAVAVHPDDPRYRDAIGREVVVPYVERAVPVIADARVEPSFGSGALKITPGHDPTDFEIGRAHGLPEPMVIGLDGRMNDQAGDLEGLTQAEADAAVVAWVKERGQLVKRENYRHSVGTCERCHTRIEPLISLQWWCAMNGPAAPAIEALRERTVRFHPESQHRFAIASLEEIPDWCLSRQLWWGHQIPIWTTPSGEVICASYRGGGAGARRRRRRADARSGRARHLVLVGALAVRHARLAGADARARGVLPGQRQLDGARDHPAVGEPDDLGRPRADGRGAVHGRDHPFDRARGRRPADVEEPRHRRRPARDDRRPRRGCDPVRPAEDLVDPGRALLARRDRGGAQAREQALERLAADPPERRGHRAGASIPPRSRSAGSWRGSISRGSRSRRRGLRSTSRPRRTCSTTSPSTTSATGTPRPSSRGCTSTRPRPAPPRSPRSSACSPSSTRCCRT